MKFFRCLGALAFFSPLLPGTGLAAETITYAVAYSFDASLGLQPGGGLVKAADGKLYGTTKGGSKVIAANADGSNPVLVGTTPGSQPSASLIETTPGTLAGTTSFGGTNSEGVIFTMDETTGTGTTLHSATVAEPNSFAGPPVLATDGYLYVASAFGGANSFGGIVRVKPDGTGFAVRHDNTAAEGQPMDGLIEATNSRLFGVTSNGGANGIGSVFLLTLAGAYGTVHSFTVAEGYSPGAGLMQASDDFLYGVASQGGANNAGAIFRVKMDGTGFEKLHDFTTTDGKSPNMRLLEASDGMLYGGTSSGGANNFGTLFRMAKDGSRFQVLHHFAAATGNFAGRQTLVESRPGVFLGMTSSGGANNFGTIFRLTIAEVVPPANAAPTLTVSGKKQIATTKAKVKLAGKVSDPNGGAVTVTAKVGKKTFRTTTSAASWKLVVKLKPGRNVVKVQAADAAGATSPKRTVKVTRN